MGYQDRDYYQDDAPRGMQLGGELSFTWRIVIVHAGLFLANLFLFADPGDDPTKHDLASFFSLNAATAREPLTWWRFLTYGWVYHRVSIQPLFWNMVGLVCFGSSVEATFGRREYLRYYLVAMWLGGLAWGLHAFLMYGMQADAAELARLRETHLYGAGGAITAVTLLYCIKYPFNTIHLMMVLPVPAWVVGLIIIVGNVFQAGQIVGNAGHISPLDVHLAGALFAIFYYYFDWNLTRIVSFSWLSNLSQRLRSLTKQRPKLRVYDADPEDDNAYRELESEADRILEKIGRDGEGSLTKIERQTLERYSRLMRQKHR